MMAFLEILRRDLRLAVREGSAVGTALGFNVVVVSLLPFALGPDLNLLQRIAPGVLWIALLLSALLSLPRIFETDLEDGTLDVLATAPLPLEAVTLAKCLAHWLTTALPLILLGPVLGLLLNLEWGLQPVVVASMLVGTPAVSFLGGIGAALTLQSRRGGLLVALLVLPFYVPTLIFGISTVSAATFGTGGAVPSLAMLAAISLAAMVIGPLAAAAALRAQLS